MRRALGRGGPNGNVWGAWLAATVEGRPMLALAIDLARAPQCRSPTAASV